MFTVKSPTGHDVLIRDSDTLSLYSACGYHCQTASETLAPTYREYVKVYAESARNCLIFRHCEPTVTSHVAFKASPTQLISTVIIRSSKLGATSNTMKLS